MCIFDELLYGDSDLIQQCYIRVLYHVLASIAALGSINIMIPVDSSRVTKQEDHLLTADTGCRNHLNEVSRSENFPIGHAEGSTAMQRRYR